MSHDEYITVAFRKAGKDIYGFFQDCRRSSGSLKTAIDCSQLRTSHLGDEKAFFETVHFNFVRFGWLYLILWLPAIVYYFFWHLSLFLFLIVLLAILFTTTYLMWGLYRKDGLKPWMVNIPILIAAFSILLVWIPFFPNEPSVMYAYFTTAIVAVFLHAMTMGASLSEHLKYKVAKAVRTTCGMFGQEHVNLAGNSRTIETHNFSSL